MVHYIHVHTNLPDLRYQNKFKISFHLTLAVSTLRIYCNNFAAEIILLRLVKVHQYKSFNCQKRRVTDAWRNKTKHFNLCSQELTFSPEIIQRDSVSRHLDSLRQRSSSLLISTPRSDILNRQHFNLLLCIMRTDSNWVTQYY